MPHRNECLSKLLFPSALSKSAQEDDEQEEGPPEGNGYDTIANAMNEIVDDLRNIAPGTDGDLDGLQVERHQSGTQYRLNGVVFEGVRAASLGVYAFLRMRESV